MERVKCKGEIIERVKKRKEGRTTLPNKSRLEKTKGERKKRRELRTKGKKLMREEERERELRVNRRNQESVTRTHKRQEEEREMKGRQGERIRGRMN